MAGQISQINRRKVMELVKKFRGLTDRDIVWSQAATIGDSTEFIVRVDYAVHLGGGYQIFTGDLVDSTIDRASPVCGKGRATPRRPLVSTKPVKTAEEREEERRRLFLAMRYSSSLDDERIA